MNQHSLQFDNIIMNLPQIWTRSRNNREIERNQITMALQTYAAPTTPGLSYPIPILTKIIGKPDAVSIKTLQRELYTNAKAIPCHHDGNRYGYLGMIMPAAEYNALNNANAWAAQANPGDYPTITAGTNSVDVTNTIKAYEQNVQRYNTMNQVDTDLKNQILAAVDRIYLASQEHATLGFAAKSAKNLLDHLVTSYGTIKSSDIEKNRAKLSAPWTPDHPIEDLWTRAHDCAAFGTLAGEAIDDAVQIRLLRQVLIDSGVFENAVDKWDDKDSGDRATMAQFIAHFNKEDERRLKKLTAKNAGYSTNPVANAATVAPGSYQQGYQQGWIAALSLKTETTPGIANNATGSSAPICLPTGDCSAISQGGIKFYYCHTHGLGRNKNHTSATCNRPAEGHKKEATLDKMMGGSTTIASRRRTNNE